MSQQIAVIRAVPDPVSLSDWPFSHSTGAVSYVVGHYTHNFKQKSEGFFFFFD